MLRFALMLAACVACADARDLSRPDGAAAAPEVAPAEPPPPPYGPEVKSLRLKRSIAVRFEPRGDAKPIGTVAKDTRVAWRSSAVGPGCNRWIEIEPRGWVCDKYLEPELKRAPAGVEIPKLRANEIVPGVYGRVKTDGALAYRSEADVRAARSVRKLDGQVTVRRVAEVMIAGRAYWKTSSGELIDARKISLHEPSRFHGVRPGEVDVPPLPLAWAQSRKTIDRKVAVYAAQSGGAPVRRLEPRTVVPVLELPDGGTRARVGETEWIDRADLHVAAPTEPPPAMLPDEKWLDVDLDEQVVVAYEGTRPVFATLVSTGNKKWPTPPGIYRVWIKFAETDMSGQMGDEQPYSVATVPWTMFFAKDLAFHTAYWHDRFGEARSHGCVNLSPLDARTLYFWADPDVPPGWSMSHGIVERPGSMVRIRDRATPSPDVMGYAKRVYAARGGVVDAPSSVPVEEPPFDGDAAASD